MRQLFTWGGNDSLVAAFLQSKVEFLVVGGVAVHFYDESRYAIDRLLQTTDSLEVYLSFMASFLSAAARVLRPGGVVALVIGDVEENGQHVPLAERVWEEMRGLVPFELLQVEVDAYDQTAKTTRVWGEERKGRATRRIV